MLRGFGMSPAARRALVMGLALVAGPPLSVPAFAQDAAAADKPVLLLEGDAATIATIPPSSRTRPPTSSLYSARLKEALAKSEKPELKQQAAGWNIYKTQPGGSRASYRYIMVINPVVKGAEDRHQQADLRGLPGRSAGDLSSWTRTAFAGRGITPLTKFLSMFQ